MLAHDPPKGLGGHAQPRRITRLVTLGHAPSPSGPSGGNVPVRLLIPPHSSTCSVLDKSPMICFIDSGNFRTNVGIARIWSTLARCGCLSRSMTSMWYFPLRCSSHRRVRFSSARTDLGVGPATYSRRSQRSLGSAAALGFLVRALIFFGALLIC